MIHTHPCMMAERHKAEAEEMFFGHIKQAKEAEERRQAAMSRAQTAIAKTAETPSVLLQSGLRVLESVPVRYLYDACGINRRSF